mgnify:CR=1 FL=1
MAIIATNKKVEVEIVEAGSYPARVYQMIQMGNIAGFQGQIQNKVRIGFELPTELKVFKEEKGEQPRVISQEYTLSFHEKSKLRKVIEACDPNALKVGEDGFLEEVDIEQLIGKECLITIAHKASKEGNQFAYIDGVTRLPKGMVCPKAINEPIVLSYDKWKQEIFDALPDFLKDKIKSSQEYQRMINPDADPF